MLLHNRLPRNQPLCQIRSEPPGIWQPALALHCRRRATPAASLRLRCNRSLAAPHHGACMLQGSATAQALRLRRRNGNTADRAPSPVLPAGFTVRCWGSLRDRIRAIAAAALAVAGANGNGSAGAPPEDTKALGSFFSAVGQMMAQAQGPAATPRTEGAALRITSMSYQPPGKGSAACL